MRFTSVRILVEARENKLLHFETFWGSHVTLARPRGAFAPKNLDLTQSITLF